MANNIVIKSRKYSSPHPQDNWSGWDRSYSVKNCRLKNRSDQCPVCNELVIPAKPWWTRQRDLITELIRIGGTVNICKGHQLKIRLCAFAGTCESPIENGQETDKFPGTPTNLPTHVYHPAMDSTL